MIFFLYVTMLQNKSDCDMCEATLKSSKKFVKLYSTVQKNESGVPVHA